MDMMEIRRTALLKSVKKEQIVYEAFNLSLDGTSSNAINTGVYLFTQENINKDFEITLTNTSGQYRAGNENSVICAKHDGNGFGFLVRSRTITENKYNGTIYIQENTNCNNLVIRRINGVITVEGDTVTNQPVPFINNVFEWPLYIGCSVDNNGNPYRFGICSIEHIVVKWL